MAFITSNEQDQKTQLYRRVFNTPDGREVVLDMLKDLHVFDTIDAGDMDALVKRNYGLFLLYNLGVMTDKNLPIIVDKMMDLEYTKDASEDDSLQGAL